MNNNRLFSYFQDIAQKAKTTVNKEEAIMLRNKLLKIGIILLSIGGVGVIASFISFTLLSFNAVNNFGGGFPGVDNFGDGFGVTLIPFFLIIPFGLCASIGGVSLYLGLGITVAKATVNFVDTNTYCPSCGDVVKEGELYCSNCGKPLLIKKVCKNCKTENDMKASYCMQCGTKLD